MGRSRPRSHCHPVIHPPDVRKSKLVTVPTLWFRHRKPIRLPSLNSSTGTTHQSIYLRCPCEGISDQFLLKDVQSVLAFDHGTAALRFANGTFFSESPPARDHSFPPRARDPIGVSIGALLPLYNIYHFSHWLYKVAEREPCCCRRPSQLENTCSD